MKILDILQAIQKIWDSIKDKKPLNMCIMTNVKLYARQSQQQKQQQLHINLLKKKRSKQHKLKTDNYTITQMTIKQHKETWKENTE